jgi:hypothetical protein
MNNKYGRLLFSKAFLTSLFVGILATLVCFAYDIYFRTVTFYGPTEYINVSSIIFLVNIILMISGTVYYASTIWFKKGDLIYTVFFLVLIGFCLWKTGTIHRFNDYQLNKNFIQLLGGTIVIIGIAILSVPYIFKHKKIVDFYYDENF